MSVTVRYEFTGDDAVQVVIDALQAAAGPSVVRSVLDGRRALAEGLVAYFEARGAKPAVPAEESDPESETDERRPSVVLRDGGRAARVLIDTGRPVEWGSSSPNAVPDTPDDDENTARFFAGKPGWTLWVRPADVEVGAWCEVAW